MQALGPVGIPVAVAPGVWRVLAPNPGPYTGPGTNSYLIQGEGGAWAVLDPGPGEASHLKALQEAAGASAAWVWLSHAHPDHAEGVGAFVKATGAQLAAWPQPNLSFPIPDLPPPDVALVDGQPMPGGFGAWQALYTPGHASDHLVFWRAEDALLLSADQVLNGVTTSVMRPDGDMQAYMDGLHRLAALKPALILPAHGGPIAEASERIAELLAHREAREAQVLAALGSEARTPEALAEALYPHLDARLWRAAAGQVEAHLVRLAGQGLASAGPTGWRLGEG